MQMDTTQLFPALNARPSSPTLGIKQLSPALGAEIVGVDLRKELDGARFAQILDAWHENLVLLFRDQQLTEEDQIRFAERFGPLVMLETKKFIRSHPAVLLVSNIREDGKPIGLAPDGELQFHSDQCHQERPAAGTFLYAIEISSKGGDTLFANAYKAYERLPDWVKRRIEGRKALNAYDTAAGPTNRRGGVALDAPSYAHPVVRVHPVTGRKALYVNRLMTMRIEDLPPEESEELLNTLFDHQERPEFIYRHVWRPGDLLMWDNRCVVHARTDFSAHERRLLLRVTTLGEKPI